MSHDLHNRNADLAARQPFAYLRGGGMPLYIKQLRFSSRSNSSGKRFSR